MTAPRPVSRRRSREAALQVLYALDLTSGAAGGEASDPEVAFAAAGDHFELPEGARAFAKELVTGVRSHLEQLDELISCSATHWRLGRMAAVDRNLLRLASYEMSHLGTPPGVAIDEAVELARRFGGERSPGFVNCVLDGVARRLEEAS